MHKRSEQDYIEDILEAAKRIISYTKGFKYDNFIIDTKTARCSHQKY